MCACPFMSDEGEAGRGEASKDKEEKEDVTDETSRKHSAMCTLRTMVSLL